jgi:hypothetical protein
MTKSFGKNPHSTKKGPGRVHHVPKLEAEIRKDKFGKPRCYSGAKIERKFTTA